MVSGWQLNRRIALALACASVAALGAGCAQKQAEGNQTPPATPVKTAVVQTVSVPETAEYLATLKSRHSAVVNPQVSGYVTQIFVKSGDAVKSGAPLMQVDPLKQQAAVGSQEASTASAKATLQYYEVQLARTKKLFDAGVASQQTLDDAQAAVNTARENLKALEDQVVEQKVELHYYTVAAPRAGVVGDIPVRVGDSVNPATLLTTVDQPGDLEAYIYVPAERAKDLQRNAAVAILDTAGQVIAQSRIYFISPEVQPDTQTVLAKAGIESSRRTLRTSEDVRARVTWGVHPGILIPVLAVSRITGQYFVYVAEGPGTPLTAHQRMIHVAGITGDNYVVLDGLKPGERLIVSGLQGVVDGAPVSETAGDTSPGGAAR
ncbi:MAG: efflux RND transporter periplasmic adaptor subunit [Candidatus Acidiferrales bacterium]